MFYFKDKQVEEFCKNVAEVVYIVGLYVPPRNLMSEQQYVDLELLFRLNDDMCSNNSEPFVQILTDGDGRKYAHLSEDGYQYALSNDFSFMPECKERDARNVSLRRAQSKLVDNSLEDKICEKCGNVLGINYSRTEFLGMVYGLINKNVRKAGPWDDVFLKSLNFPGSYLN